MESSDNKKKNNTEIFKWDGELFTIVQDGDFQVVTPYDLNENQKSTSNKTQSENNKEHSEFQSNQETNMDNLNAILIKDDEDVKIYEDDEYVYIVSKKDLKVNDGFNESNTVKTSEQEKKKSKMNLIIRFFKSLWYPRANKSEQQVEGQGEQQGEQSILQNKNDVQEKKNTTNSNTSNNLDLFNSNQENPQILNEENSEVAEKQQENNYEKNKIFFEKSRKHPLLPKALENHKKNNQSNKNEQFLIKDLSNKNNIDDYENNNYESNYHQKNKIIKVPKEVFIELNKVNNKNENSKN